MAAPLKATVLNVDDHEASRYLRTRTLERAGFRVLEAADGSTTLELVARQAPDLVLLDVNLPGMSGLEVCQAIKTNPATAFLPVLHVSASAVEVKDKAHGLEGGADGYLIEPVEPEELIATVKALLRLSQAERSSQALNRVHEAIGSTLDAEEIMRRVVVESAQAIRAESAAVSLLEDSAWTVRYAYGLESAIGHRIPHRGEDPHSISAILRQGRPVVIEDAASDPRVEPDFKERFRLRSLLFAPLRMRGELTGMLVFHFHSAAVGFNPAQVELASKLGAAISLALENARLYAEAEEGRKILEALMENIPEGITFADAPDARIRMVSRYGREMTGRPREQIEGIPAELHPERWRVLRRDGVTLARPEELPLTRATLNGEIVRDEELWLERADGTKLPLLCNAGPIRDRSGAITGGVIAWRDISQLKRLEAQLIEARKMEAVGLLAGGVAHEFNNMLMVISGHCHLLLEESADRKRMRQGLDTILKSANRLSKLTTELLAFAGRQMIQPAVLDLNAIVRRLQGPVRHLISERIQLTVALDPGLPKIKADAGQMEQVALALAMHGRDAMADGGRLGIETASVKLDGPSEELGLAAGPYAVLAVSNTGPALDEQARQHLFEPFYAGGLGLSTVYGIARQNQGDVRVVSGPGEGTRIEVYLPAAE